MKAKTKKTFEVKIYYSGYCTYEILEEDEIKAIEKARKSKINGNEILSNLENWKEADTVDQIVK